MMTECLFAGPPDLKKKYTLLSLELGRGGGFYILQGDFVVSMRNVGNYPP